MSAPTNVQQRDAINRLVAAHEAWTALWRKDSSAKPSTKQAARERRNAAVRACIDAGIPSRDVADRLGLSPQRANYLYHHVAREGEELPKRKRAPRGSGTFTYLSVEAQRSLQYIRNHIGGERGDVIEQALNAYADLLQEQQAPTPRTTPMPLQLPPGSVTQLIVDLSIHEAAAIETFAQAHARFTEEHQQKKGVRRADWPEELLEADQQRVHALRRCMELNLHPADLAARVGVTTPGVHYMCRRIDPTYTTPRRARLVVTPTGAPEPLPVPDVQSRRWWTRLRRQRSTS